MMRGLSMVAWFCQNPCREGSGEDRLRPVRGGGIDRSDGLVVIQVFFRSGRTVEQKKALYKRTAELLSEAGVRPQDVFVTLVENEPADWSFGNGEAQYVK